MKKTYRKLGLYFSLIFFVIALDQFFKWFFQNRSFATPDFLGFSLEGPVKNIYFLFGFKITSEFFFIHLALISICLLFFFYYFIFIFLADDKKFYLLKIALSFIFGGWMSNLIDKLQQTYVLDYIKWSIFNEFIYFNLADVFQTCGWILLIHQVILLRADIFRSNERRKSWFVLNKLQYEFLAYFTLIFILMTVFFILLIKQVLLVVGLSDSSMIKDIGFTFLIGTLLALVFLYFSIGLFFAYFSNKIYGPVYAFEKYMRELMDQKSDSKDFQLRKGDQFKNLESLARDIKNYIENKKSTKK